MRRFEQTKEFTESCYRAWQNQAYPVQLIWEDKDPFLTWEEQGMEFAKGRPGVPVTGVSRKFFIGGSLKPLWLK